MLCFRNDVTWYLPHDSITCHDAVMNDLGVVLVYKDNGSYLVQIILSNGFLRFISSVSNVKSHADTELKIKQYHIFARLDNSSLSIRRSGNDRSCNSRTLIVSYGMIIRYDSYLLLSSWIDIMLSVGYLRLASNV